MKNVKSLYDSGLRTSRSSCSFARVVEIDGHRFKVTHDTGNCYSNTRISVQTPTKEWALVATDFDLVGKPSINYVSDEYLKKKQMEDIYQASLTYIKKAIL